MTIRGYCQRAGYDHRVYEAWCSMRARCRNSHKSWGGRGIKVCARWDNYALFAADIGPHPGGARSSVERKNNNGNYTPRNCIWATPKVQGRNKRYGNRSGRLSLATVAAMRKRYAQGGITQKALARQYGVTQSMVSRTVNLRSWI